MAVLQLLDRPKLFSVKILKQFHFAKIPPKLATLFPFMTTAVCLQYTVWKFQDFSVIQIIHEIKFGESRNSKTALRKINFGLLQKVKNCNSDNN